MQIGFLGLGKMGSRMVLKILSEGHDVVVWNRSPDPVSALEMELSSLPQLPHRGKLITSSSIKYLVSVLPTPRVVWLMLTAGSATESVLADVSQFLRPNDIVIDGGNSYFKDTERRYRDFEARGIRYLGIGVSGGVHALENGYPLMVGGDTSAYEEMGPVLDTLSRPRGGHAYFGTGGAGHFVKMVHNGIEYGMMQAIGEGFGVLERSPYSLDLLEVAKLWQKSTIVSGFLLDRAKDALEKDEGLSRIDGVIAASGEGGWTVAQGKDEGVPVENIAQSLDFRLRSQLDERVRHSFAARMVAALRHEFGGHEVKKK
jgi:6-phosphogluconate dehydrogenase